MIVKKTFDTIMTEEEFQNAKKIVQDALENNVTFIINVGTSYIESLNSIELAKKFNSVYCAIGIHPNDATSNYKNELNELKKFLKYKENPGFRLRQGYDGQVVCPGHQARQTTPGSCRHDSHIKNHDFSATANKIVAIGECGLDYHYPEYDKNLQYDAFKAQIEIALENDLALVIHTRSAKDEVLKILSEYKNDKLRGTIHCFSEDLQFAQDAIKLGFVLGIGGTITYPKNEILRNVLKTVGIENIILETDAPYLSPQEIRGKVNTPAQIKNIAQFIADLLGKKFEEVSNTTTENVRRIFRF
ncbi:TatD family hydrolase [Candidatus Dependentiae bacterium]|nr:TatD family hydrolase [Candidatus Dependentiae bacterium]